ncbi:ANTAR domain-containing response regulator [Vineibacter terrae]|nr:ANTAR domain-containing protein [Vineibacter terrae]HEX2890200.1 ANTAR domain-containing protein [Vineibacter terrae]
MDERVNAGPIMSVNRSGGSIAAPLRILLVDDDAQRGAMLERTLSEAGHRVVAQASGTDDLLDHVRAHGPDMIIVDVSSPNRDMLEHMRHVSREQARPIVMFVDDTDEAMAVEAVKAGVTSYVVDGLSPARVKPIMNVAIARFRALQELRDELDKARATLVERKLVERAKGILMAQRGLSEEDAYRALRKLAMDKGKRLAEIAEQVIAISDLLAPPKA